MVHAKGSGAYGYFEVTADVTRWTRAKFLAPIGKRTELFIRCSTVAGEKGSADSVRDPRGFAIKFYTEEGNYDLVGNNTPVFFIRDPLKFPDFNAAGKVSWVKYHFKTDQGIKNLFAEEAAQLAGTEPDHHQRDLLKAIERGEFPSWTVTVQIMSAAEAANYRYNPFDLTKVWPNLDYPQITIGRMVLNRNPENYFAEVEQAAFNPAHFVPGIGPSPDKMLQGRLFAYGDTHRYRIGVNHTQLPVNRPHAPVNDYLRDGAMRFDGNSGREKNYEPNSFDGPVQSNQPVWAPTAVQRLAANIAGRRWQVTKEDIIERSIAHFRKADPEYGERVAKAVAAKRSAR